MAGNTVGSDQGERLYLRQPNRFGGDCSSELTHDERMARREELMRGLQRPEGQEERRELVGVGAGNLATAAIIVTESPTSRVAGSVEAQAS